MTDEDLIAATLLLCRYSSPVELLLKIRASPLALLSELESIKKTNRELNSNSRRTDEWGGVS